MYSLKPLEDLRDDDRTRTTLRTVRCRHLQDLQVLQGTTKSPRTKSQELTKTSGKVHYTEVDSYKIIKLHKNKLFS